MTIGRLESHIAADSVIIGWLVLASGDKQLILLVMLAKTASMSMLTFFESRYLYINPNSLSIVTEQ